MTGSLAPRRRKEKPLTPTPGRLVCDPAPSLIATAGATLAVAPLELSDPSPPRFALEGDHAAHRTVGSDSSPHQPSRATRRVVPRDPRDGARRHPRGEPATGHGAALLPPDPPVSSYDVVRRDPAPQRAASAGELGVDLRRVPALQRPRGARSGCRARGMPPVQRAVSRRMARFGFG